MRLRRRTCKRGPRRCRRRGGGKGSSVAKRIATAHKSARFGAPLLAQQVIYERCEVADAEDGKGERVVWGRGGTQSDARQKDTRVVRDKKTSETEQTQSTGRCEQRETAQEWRGSNRTMHKTYKIVSSGNEERVRWRHHCAVAYDGHSAIMVYRSIAEASSNHLWCTRRVAERLNCRLGDIAVAAEEAEEETEAAAEAEAAADVG